jgi:hypothetical protein
LICVATFRLPFLHATLLAAFGQEEILGLDPAEGMDTQQLVVIPSRDKLAIGAKSLTWQVYSTQTSTVLATWSGSLDELNDLQADAVKFTEELFDALVFCFSHDIVSFRAVSLQGAYHSWFTVHNTIQLINVTIFSRCCYDRFKI